MHETMKRLYEAAEDAGVTGLSNVALALEELPQTVKNWEYRGVSKAGQIKAQATFHCNANWIATGLGNKGVNGEIPLLTPEPERDSVVDDLAALAALRPEEANAYRANIKRDLAAAMREQRPAKRFLGLAEPERRIEDTGAFHKKRFTDINTPAPQPGKKGVKK